jgi:UDP-glucose 4-epimerase
LSLQHDVGMPQTILITGGAGTLGRSTAGDLVERGDRVRVLDLVQPPPADGVEAVRGDLRRRDDVLRAMDGVDAVVHAAAWHGMHLKDHPASDFWELNVDATFTVFEAAVERGVSRAVVASTMGVYGASRTRGTDGRAVRLHEALPLRPTNVYELSKVVTEQIAASYDERAERGVRSVALRFGMFVPEPFLHSGIRFLYGGIDERDVAAAVILALDRTLDAPPGNFTAFNAFSAVPYDDIDALQLSLQPLEVVARHWPDAPTLLERSSISLWGPIHEWYDVSLARDVLRWSPRFGFDTFLEALREGR